MNTEDRQKRDARKQWKAVAEFVAVVESHIKSLDAEMQKPSDEERGKRIAQLCNILEMAKDRLKRFELGMDLGTPAIRQLKPKRSNKVTI